jgi:hypothetical protein
MSTSETKGASVTGIAALSPPAISLSSLLPLFLVPFKNRRDEYNELLWKGSPTADTFLEPPLT